MAWPSWQRDDKSAAQRAPALAVSGLGLRTRSRDPLGELPVEKLERPNGAAFAQLVRA